MDIVKNIDLIQNDLRELGYVGKLIDYVEFNTLYQKYGENIEEKDFAQKVLLLNTTQYNNIKEKGAKAKILRGLFKNLSQEDMKEIQIKLKGQGYIGKPIDYKELQKLHQQYAKDMEEKDFAQKVLLINGDQYSKLKNNVARAKILRSLLLSSYKEENEEVQNNLRNQGYVEKLINYKELQDIHRQYGNGMEEKTFAQKILLLTNTQYKNMKDKGVKAKILNGLLKDLDEEFVLGIQNSLKEQGYVEALITYSQLQSLREYYAKDLDEVTFAKVILQMSSKSYSKLVKGEVKRVKILKSEEVSKDDFEQMKRILKEDGFERKLITYEELQKIHRKYAKQISEKIFAENVLEISIENYFSSKNQGTKVRILCNRSQVNLIKEKYLKESRFYTKDEILEICDNNDISLKNFINCFLNGYSKYFEEYLEIINEGKIWIGKCKMTDEFVENNSARMKKVAKYAIRDIKRKFTIDHNSEDEDLIQEALLNIINNRGDIEKNFNKKEEIVNRKLYTGIRKYIWFRVLEKEKIRYITLPLEKTLYRNKQGIATPLKELISSSDNTENEALDKVKQIDTKENKDLYNITEKCIEELKNQIQNGMSREGALENTAQKLNLGKQEMVDAMQNYLIANGKVKMAQQKVEFIDDEEIR